ncbi:MAG: DinB family protein [Anaerolineae bacterium]
MSESKRERLALEPAADCDPVIAVALWGLQDARRRTGEALHHVNPAALEWQLNGGGHSIATLLYHIAAIELDWLHSDVAEGKLPEDIWQLFPHDVRDANGKLTIVKGETLESLWSRLEQVRALLLTTFKRMTLDEYRRPRVLERYEVTPEWVLYHLMQHEAEHRDELRRLRQNAENEVV